MDRPDATAPQPTCAPTPVSAFGNADRIFLGLVMACSLGLVLAMGIDSWIRSRHQDQPAGEWIRCLDLGQPALWPAGSPERMPQAIHPAVTLRHTPHIPMGNTHRRPAPRRHP